MKLLTFKTDTGLRLGIQTAAGVIDVKAARESVPVDHLADTPTALFATGLPALAPLADFAQQASAQAKGAAWLLDEAALELGACVPNPGKIICVGLNYKQHAIETGLGIPTNPVLFSKYNNAVAASGEGVPLPSNAVKYDYEAELVIVIGKRAKYVSEDDALGYVMGYCNTNDVSARDLQLLTSQWMLGKTLDKFLPLGPYLVTPDEVGDPQNLPVRCWLNDELRQDSNTADMVFGIREIISHISHHMTLEPGDVISTGTPEGVIMGMEEKIWLKPGDVVTVEVGALGRLTNLMVAESV
jgi:2-keto-4-pentenoate hydratase/2-oxohepta-3-ene-1,7-dioic acid hydratase in catechol pathway